MRADAGLAEEQGAVLARDVGQARQRHRDRVGRGDAPELPHAGVRDSAFDPNASGRIPSDLREPQGGRPTGTSRIELVDFKIDFLNEIPIIWLVFSVVLIIGAIYYLAVQRNKPYEAVVAPTDEDLRASSGLSRRREGGPMPPSSFVSCHHRIVKIVTTPGPPSTSVSPVARCGCGSIRTADSSARTSGSRPIAGPAIQPPDEVHARVTPSPRLPTDRAGGPRRQLRLRQHE